MRKSLWIKPEIRARFEAKMAECLNIAKDKSGKDIKPPILMFRQCGKRAGMCSVRWGKGYVILNYDLVHKVSTHDEMLNVTLPHEIAHWVDHEINGGWKGNPHGYQWRRIMAWFGVDAERCHNMDMTGVKTRQTDTTRFQYKCDCRTFNLTAIRHRRHQAGNRYHCTRCGAVLKWLAVVAAGVTAPVAQRPIEVPRETRPVAPIQTTPEPPKGPQYKTVTKFVNGVLTNERILIQS